jgi:hypothetical protein
MCCWTFMFIHEDQCCTYTEIYLLRSWYSVAVASSPASCSPGLGFAPRLIGHLFWVRCFIVLFSSSRHSNQKLSRGCFFLNLTLTPSPPFDAMYAVKNMLLSKSRTSMHRTYRTKFTHQLHGYDWNVEYCLFYESLPVQELTTSLCNLLALVHPEGGGDTILRNVGSYKSHTASSPRRW